MITAHCTDGYHGLCGHGIGYTRCLCWCHNRVPLFWISEFWDSAIAQGTQVCVQHKGLHVWTWLDAREGFCMDIRQIERVSEARHATKD
jgi:hypothetical protein